jgi:hypothetical protein
MLACAKQRIADLDTFIADMHRVVDGGPSSTRSWSRR